MAHDGEGAIIAAARNGDERAVAALLESEPSLGIAETSGDTLLHVAGGSF